MATVKPHAVIAAAVSCSQRQSPKGSTSTSGDVPMSLKRHHSELERQASNTNIHTTKLRRTTASEFTKPGNPPQALVTLSVKVGADGVLSIAEGEQRNVPVPRVSQANNVTKTSLGQLTKTSYKAYQQINRTAAQTRPPVHHMSVRVTEKVPPSGSGHINRTVHFTLGVAKVMKSSQFVDGSTQVELRPLGLEKDPRLPPLYGCIDGGGELQLSMGNYNQNALGRMASLVAAAGLEEKPGAQGQAKRIVLVGGKAWPTFPVAVTILDTEAPTQQVVPKTQVLPVVAPGACPYITVQEKVPTGMLTRNPRSAPKPTVQMLSAGQKPVVRPVTSKIGILEMVKGGPLYPRVTSTATYRCVPLTSKTAVLVAENENNSASSGKEGPTVDSYTGTPKLQRADHYGSTESVCSIDTSGGPLYIADNTDTSPPSSPQGRADEVSEPVSRGESAAETKPGKDTEGSELPIVHDVKAFYDNSCSAQHPTNSHNNKVDPTKAVSSVESPMVNLLEPSAFLNNRPADPTEEATASTRGGDSVVGTGAGPGVDPDTQAEGVANFLNYLQELNKLMDSVLAGRPVENTSEEK